MSIHKSLNLGGGLATVRSVFTRRERLAKLELDDRREVGESVFGLPKVRTQLKVKSKKKSAGDEAATVTDADAGDGKEAATE